MGGTGEHLLFAYWSTANYMNTNVNVHSPLGVKDSMEMKNVVHIMVRDADGDTVTSFNVCLLPGDSWTANFSMGGLMVVDAGGCDGDVVGPAGGRGSTMMSPPMMGEMASLGDVDSGYLEAWLIPTGTLEDGTGTADPDDMDAADNATPRYISGAAMLVSPMSGFSSSYNATALVGCGNDGDNAIVLTNDDGDGCWSLGTGDNAPDVVQGEEIRTTLGGDILTGRWTAINDENIMSHTKLVLTFPMDHLNYAAVTTGVTEDVPAGTDPVSIIAFDDTGAVALDNREVMLDMNVNMCMVHARRQP